MDLFNDAELTCRFYPARATIFATFLMADGCDYLTGQTIAIDGTSFGAGGGNFARLLKLSQDEWDQMREMIRSANDKDKAQRSV